MVSDQQRMVSNFDAMQRQNSIRLKNGELSKGPINISFMQNWYLSHYIK